MAAEPISPGAIKKVRSTCLLNDQCSTLEDLLKKTLPDKKSLIPAWIEALAMPSIGITSINDVRRLDVEDISMLPLPPLVKGIFRRVLAEEDEKVQEQRAVLKETKARAQAFLTPLRDRSMQPPLAGSKYFQDLKGYRLILPREEIEAGVRIVAHRIETWSKGERIVLVAILKGAFMFLSDLCRMLVRPYSVFFVEASSYKDERKQGDLQIACDFADSKFCDATSKRAHKVVIIDELLDNGKTMADMKSFFLTKLSGTHKENDILTVCLFSKLRERKWAEADITGIPNLPDLWLVGYGLDDRGTKRGWTEIFAIPKVKIVETLETQEVEKLLQMLDDAAALTGPHVFAGFELTYNHKHKYRVTGVVPQTNGMDATKITNKGDIVEALSRVQTTKGKFDQELQFSFIADNLELVAEDQIFSGNNQVYAEMRCRLRNSIAQSADHLGLVGLPALL